jgi:hypothetical protein
MRGSLSGFFSSLSVFFFSVYFSFVSSLTPSLFPFPPIHRPDIQASAFGVRYRCSILLRDKQRYAESGPYPHSFI